MKKTCKHIRDYCQVFTDDGDVRICGWRKNCVIGNLQKEDLSAIYHSDAAKQAREEISNGDFSNCFPTCPYLADEKRKKAIMVPYDEDGLSEYPLELSVSFEGNCNYRCICCESISGKHHDFNDTKKFQDQYKSIVSNIRKALPYVKRISAHGTAELFASPYTMELLSQWNPKFPKEECEVVLETNGSLFNRHNWEKIKNLGEYNLKVDVTVMSFDEDVYQYLSGTKLPISRIEENLKFMSDLRKNNVINMFEIATVLQEANFREMPEFTRKCIEEYHADKVRLRPIFPGGIYDKNIQWFFDVRNPYHPYYPMFKKMMEDPIFDDPRVYKWRGELDSPLGPHPALRDSETVEGMNGVIHSIGKNVLPYGITRYVQKKNRQKKGVDEWGGVK